MKLKTLATALALGTLLAAPATAVSNVDIAREHWCAIKGSEDSDAATTELLAKINANACAEMHMTTGCAAGATREHVDELLRQAGQDWQFITAKITEYLHETTLRNTRLAVGRRRNRRAGHGEMLRRANSKNSTGVRTLSTASRFLRCTHGAAVY